MPADLAAALVGHDVSSVLGLGWRGVKNGELLGRMADRFDVLLTMDRNIRFQQNLSGRPFGVLIVSAASNRMYHLLLLVPAILEALPRVKQSEFHSVGA